MGFNEFIGKLFGNKATRDMKEIKPWVDKIKAVGWNLCLKPIDAQRGTAADIVGRGCAQGFPAGTGR